MTDNPFAAPATITTALPVTDPQSLGSIAKRVFLAWEGLRLIYNAILIVETVVLMVAWMDHLLASMLGMIVFGGIISNLAFLAGPMVETYVCWLGYTRLWPRWLMFVLGTAFTMLMAAVSIWMMRQL